MSKETIPIVVKKFFNDTLPNVMLHAWLQVMSVFSSSAQDQLSRLTGPLGDVDEVSDEVVADAEEQRKAR
jgi:hypothetical protein